MSVIMTAVRKWLDSIGLGQYADAFEENAIELDQLSSLSDGELKELGVAALGHRKRIRDNASSVVAALSSGSEEEARFEIDSEAERRQLTVLFADLVASTELSQRLDPEDLRVLMRNFQDLCKVTIDCHDGYVARYMGDGVLAYFGYPLAHEDDPQQAVRAGLALVKAISALPPVPSLSSRLAVRVGIATGMVVVGDIVGSGASQESAVVGETANLAARLQSVATAGSVLIAERTRDLIGSSFDCEYPKARELRGFAASVPCCRVFGERLVESRFAASSRGALAPVIGREEEISLCLNRWYRASRGAAQMVMISGEPGIGKSRLVAAIREQVAARTQLLQCSPHHTNSALYPIIQKLERVAHVSPTDSETVQGADAIRDEALAILGELIESDAIEDRPRPKGWDARSRKEQMLERLAEYIRKMTDETPLLLVFEDMHWADPTTVELIERLTHRCEKVPLLMLLTFRPEFDAPWVGRSQALLLALNRLERRDAELLAQRVAGDNQSISAELFDEIISRADGVPLFIEELTRAVIESGLSSSAAPSEGHGDIPATLRDSLTARLDALPTGKQVAQCGAVIGREFSHELLNQISGASLEQLGQGLAELTHSGLVTQLGESTAALYTFKHALVQDAAYSTLLRERRGALHFRVAAALETRRAQGRPVELEVIAHHYLRANVVDRAVDLFGQAGELAFARSAEVEAVAHFEAALTALESTTDDDSKQSRELGLLVSMLPALMATRGYGSDDAKATCDRAKRLSQQVGTTREIAMALWAESLCHQVRGDILAARTAGYELLNLSRKPPTPSFELAARTRLAVVEYFHGEFHSAQEHLSESRRLFDAGEHTEDIYLVVNDPMVETLAYAAMTWWTVGLIEQAVEAIEAGLRRADELDHPFTHALILAGATWFFQRLGDVARTQQLSLKMLEVCRKFRFRFREAQAQILLAWTKCAQGDAGTSIHELEQGIEACKATGARANFTYYWAMLAEQYLRLLDTNGAKAALESGFLAIEAQREHHWEVELHRLRGDLALVDVAEGREEAVRHYQRALVIARRQGAKTLALRSALSLARLLNEGGEADEARRLLESTYETFTQGLATPDLQRARVFLEELPSTAP